ncbi:hypothetical protein [Streptomyces sp. NPDC006879]|uniref:hypothetical protein n=1 Tax=Streptomyces sp. NPDC006879 TaxID=3364767 RepID=UPI0036898738
MAYRYWCGECEFKTTWLNESQTERQQIEHYASKHPGIEPGGHVQINRRDADGVGCLQILGVLVLLLILAAACRH